MKMRDIFIAGFLSVLSALIFGCAAVEHETQTKISAPNTSDGVYHSVKKGQTIYQISKLYQTDIDTIISANSINDCSKIEIGQKIFIPYRHEERQFSNDSSDFIWPIDGKIICGYGSILDNSPSKGISLLPRGSLDVHAAKSGRVVLIHPSLKGYGKTIIIGHDDNFYTVYTNLYQISVNEDQEVPKGAVIARLGNSPNQQGPFLHFEIRKGSYAQNPLYFLPVR